MGIGSGHGRRGAEFACEHVERKASKARLHLSGDVLDAYLEALERIDELTPHYRSQFDKHSIAHGAPQSAADLEEIEVIEHAVNQHVPEEMHLKSAVLYRMIQTR